MTSRLSTQEMAELCALADGSLPAERRAAVEARVSASPELRELLARQRRAVAAAQAVEADPLPASLQADVETRARARRRGPARRLVPRLAAVGAVAVAAVVVTLVLTGGPAGPSVADAARLAAQPPSGPAPAQAGSAGTTLAVGVEGVAFPDLRSSFGWRAVGTRGSRIDGRDATVVFYAKGPERIAYVIVAGSALPRPDSADGTVRAGVRFQTLRIDGRLAVTWRRLGHTCVLTGEIPRAQLLALASWRGGGALAY